MKRKMSWENVKFTLSGYPKWKQQFDQTAAENQNVRTVYELDFINDFYKTKTAVHYLLDAHKHSLQKKLNVLGLSTDYHRARLGLIIESKESLGEDFGDKIRDALVELNPQEENTGKSSKKRKQPLKQSVSHVTKEQKKTSDTISLSASLGVCEKNKTVIEINPGPNTAGACGKIGALLCSSINNPSAFAVKIVGEKVEIIFYHQLLLGSFTHHRLLQIVNEVLLPLVVSKLNRKRMSDTSSWTEEEWKIISPLQIVSTDLNQQQNLLHVEVPQTDLAAPQTSDPNKKQKLKVSIGKNGIFWKDRCEEMNVESSENERVVVKNVIDLTL